MIQQAPLPVERIRALAADRGFLDAMREFYAKIDHRVASRRPVCRNRGVCCRFGEFGHRLYVTPLELAFFAAETEPLLPILPEASSCPYQVEGMCDARIGRPMGCRIFFCESAGQGWQEDLTESALRELRGLHERFDVPYAYVEWLDALAQVGGGA